ncbi:substrate binding domain-containing protein [Pontiellaceae bacterium B1224]|nr:substrate binding domain-containing protein [Pontiellaceae bacterium B1224]
MRVVRNAVEHMAYVSIFVPGSDGGAIKRKGNLSVTRRNGHNGGGHVNIRQDQSARNILSEAKDLENRIVLGAETLSGFIRVSAPFDLGQSRVEPVINSFLAEHPDISIELILNDGGTNMIDEGIDIAFGLGRPADSTLRIRNLGMNQRVLVASPDYISKQGKPKNPNDLMKHNCLVMRFGSEIDNVWHLQLEGRSFDVVVRGNRISNDGRLTRHWCLAGHGIALKSQWDVNRDIGEGKLVQLLKKNSPPPTQLHMLFPPGKSHPARISALADKLAQAFEQQ